MKSYDLNKMLIKHLPQLSERFNDEISWQEGHDTGCHTVFGDVLTPYLVECILQNNRQGIAQIFDFLENILCLKDEYADEVIWLSVLESISYLFKTHVYLTEFLGEHTKKTLEKFL